MYPILISNPSTFFTILQCFFLISFGKNDYYKYTYCTQPFICSSITRNISFPFNGNNRPFYCGQPGYRLRCEDGIIELVLHEPNVDASLPNYSVLNINSDTQRLHIVPVDTHTDSCPAPSANVSFSPEMFPPFERFFTYSLPPDTVNITLFYECPPIPALKTSSYPCSPYDNSTSNYIWNYNLASAGSPPVEVWRCRFNVLVPIPQRLADRIASNASMVQEVLRAGFEVNYTTDSAFCKGCQHSGGACGYDWNHTRPMCYCHDDQYRGWCPTTRPGASVRLKITIGVSAGVGCLVAVALLFILWKRPRSSSNFIKIWERRNRTQKLVEDFLKNNGSVLPKRYNYYDLKKITSSFKNKIGQGGYGEVYKGKLLDGRLVAVKLLNDAKGTGGQEFINEIASISWTSHVNVASLLGYCFDGSKRALIYEFMANGSLEKFIYGRNALELQSQLGWETLYQVAVGVARGLEYLHRGCNTRILHFDIKPHNILLDLNFTPKISDFGLAKLCPRNESIISMLDARGTAGYIAPEVFNRQFGGVSYKSDVYSYGMMILEIVGKRKNIDVNVDHTSQIYFPNWIHKRLEIGEDLGLNEIMSPDEEDKVKKMTLVALWCIQTNPMDRPTMTRVVEMLQATHELLSIPPNPYLRSPPRSPRSPVSSSIA